VHVKNGWRPLPTHGWRIHSIVMLTQDNPTMAYGITTIQTIARAINHDLRGAAFSYRGAPRAGRAWPSSR
jgi:hypothetical protein